MDSHEIEMFRGCFYVSGNNIRLVTQKGVVPIKSKWRISYWRKKAYDKRSKTMKVLTYTHVGDYYIPDIALSEQISEPIGKHGMMRRGI